MAGSWEDPFQTASGSTESDILVAVHMALLHTGKVLAWGYGKLVGTSDLSTPDCWLWDPATGDFTNKPNSHNIMLCAGHCALPDGRLLVAGGQHDTFVGTVFGDLFDPVDDGGTWTATAYDMHDVRWYPTCTTLPDGRLLVAGGTKDEGIYNQIPEVFDPDGGSQDAMWEQLTDADQKLTQYAYMFVLPDQITVSLVTFPAGSVFFAGPDRGGSPGIYPMILDWVDQVWSAPITTGGANEGSGSAVMYKPGKILRCGGEHPGIATVRMIDLTASGSHTWTGGPSLNNARRNHNLVMLPDGKILCVGGNKWGDDGRNVPGDNYVAPVLTPEILDPSAQSPAWVEHAPMTAPRRYHSTALLLPDARVLVAGGNFYASMQIFSPPYLDGSPSRIAITSAPSTISYSTSFDITVSVPSGKSVNKVSLIRLGSVTHGFDQDQRYLQLLYTLPIPPTGTVHVTPPANAKYAPPGYYMLWVLDNSGVPCAEAKIVKLQ